MLVAISDIHFIDSTAGEHNLPYDAFESIFLFDIASLAKDKHCKELKVLLLGDIVDVIRTAQWLDIPQEDRPWGTNGRSDIPVPRANSATERQVLNIIGQVPEESLRETEPPPSLSRKTILSKNWKTFKLFRELRKQMGIKFEIDIPTEIIYVPGNHDRLCNLYPSVRAALQKILGLSVSPQFISGDITDAWSYRYDFMDEAYGVYARHGHQYDIWNHTTTDIDSPESHIQVPVGDVITTEFAVKLPWMLEHLKDEYPIISDELVRSTKAIDNVRPLGRMMEWIYYRIKHEDNEQARRALDEAFDRVIREFLDIDFIKTWHTPATHVDEVLRASGSRWLNWLPRTILDLFDAKKLLPLFWGAGRPPEDQERDPFTQAAYQERIWKENHAVHFILYGHTHKPLQRPLDYRREREVIYLNTGTWRNTILKTADLEKSPHFVELQQMTYSVFYREDEAMDNKHPHVIGFDTWTGTRKKIHR